MCSFEMWEEGEGWGSLKVTASEPESEEIDVDGSKNDMEVNRKMSKGRWQTWRERETVNKVQEVFFKRGCVSLLEEFRDEVVSVSLCVYVCVCVCVCGGRDVGRA